MQERSRTNQLLKVDLAVLHKRATSMNDGNRSAVVTFVAGTRYHHLCRNFLLHLKRADVINYVLVALDALSVQWLREQNEPVVDATPIISGTPKVGSDRFGSDVFFVINGARYRTLLTMLASGISLFVLDLDVVVISDPSSGFSAIHI